MGSRRIRRFSSRHESHGLGAGTKDADQNIMEDLFGFDSNAHLNNEKTDAGGAKKKFKRTTFLDIPETAMEHIFGYLRKNDVKSLRLVTKEVSEVATKVYHTCHDPIQIDSENEIFRFRELMDTALNFPFSRFRIIFQHIPRHMLITFTSRYANHIKSLRIEPFEKKDEISQEMYEPVQRDILKLTGIIQELTDVEELEIHFPSMSNFDYYDMEFEKDYELKSLKIFSINFARNGFSGFSSELTMNILKHAQNLDKFKLRLPEPSNQQNELLELRRVLSTADSVDVRTIWITLLIHSNHNLLLDTIGHAIINGAKVRNLLLLIGNRCDDYKGIVRMLEAASDTLWSLVIIKIGRRGEPKPAFKRGSPLLRLPPMDILKSLDVDSYSIFMAPIQPGQFPNLIQLTLHLKYGDDGFYKQSVLHPLEKLKLHFHETSIMKILPPVSSMDNLISEDLIKLELVKPPPGHLTFMSHWGQNIETLIISADQDDPTYPVNKVLGQLNGSVQIREGYFNHIGLLQNLRRLRLLFPIDEWTALYLSDLAELWELIVDDSLVTKETIREMKRQHNIYISWRHSN